MTRIALLPDRAVLAVGGEDRIDFLQGLVSNDVTEATSDHAVWAALLTPHGRWLADFFILAHRDRLLLDCEAASRPMLRQRLGRFRLKSRVTLAEEAHRVHASWDGGPPAVPGLIAARDPRLPEAGWRVLSEDAIATNATAEDWDRHRLRLGLPDGSRDLTAEQSLLLEAGFDELHGVSWTKGCYMGQELTARTKYRGLLKRRLLPVAVEGPVPAPGTPVMRDGREVGTMRSALGAVGLALLRLDALGGPLTADGAVLQPSLPAWMSADPPGGDEADPPASPAEEG